MNIKERMLEHLNVWELMLKKIFPISIPNGCVWEDKEQIISILNVVGTVADSNHMFFPFGGGLDIAGAALSNEKDCIELLISRSDCPYIIKPLNLEFQSFKNNFEWSYFRIETVCLKPSGIYENIEFNIEELTEITPGVYVERSAWDTGYYGYDYEENAEKVLPKTARLVVRCLAGSVVIFSKASPYNFLENKFKSYNGHHDSMSSEDFKNFISQFSHLEVKEML